MSQQTTNRTFDELASGLASGTLSRGKALKLMGAALLGGTLASLGGVAAADDECKPVDKKCRKDHQCCSGKCSGGKCAAAGGGICPTGGSCDTTFPFGCQNNQSCFCTTTTEGTTFCSQSIACGPNVFCTSTQDCPSGWVCSDTCCDGRGKICNPPCGTFPGVAASSADNQGMSGH